MDNNQELEKEEKVFVQVETSSEEASLKKPAEQVEQKAEVITPEVIEKEMKEIKKGKKEKEPKKTRVMKGWAIALLVLGLIATLIASLPLVSTAVVSLYYILLIVFAVATLFLILLNPDFTKLFHNANKFVEFISEMIQYSIYVYAGALALLITSLVLFATANVKGTKKKEGQVVGIILSSILIALAAAGLGVTIFTIVNIAP